MATWDSPLPPPPRGQTDMYKNINFPQLRWRAVNISEYNHLRWALLYPILAHLWLQHRRPFI